MNSVSMGVHMYSSVTYTETPKISAKAFFLIALAVWDLWQCKMM